MATWNHRVCKSVSKGVNVDGSIWKNVVYAIHEVHYNKNGEIYGITEKPVPVLTDDDQEHSEEMIASLQVQLTQMASALSKPVIDLETVEYVSADE